MFNPEDFFDLEEFEHRKLFDGVEYVWDVLKRLADYIKSTLKPGIYGKVMEGAYVAEDVYIGEGTVVEPGAVVKGPTIIGKNTEVRQAAYIRGDVIVGNNCIVGHATELKGAVLLDTAKAPHFNYVGDSIVGRETNLGAGTILSNLKVTWELVTVKVEDKVYETGLLKFGAIIGDYAETGCNTVMNPGSFLGKRTLTYPCMSLRGYFPPDSIVKLKDGKIEVVPRLEKKAAK